MEITEKQLQGKPKQVGTWNGKKVLHIATKGGLHMIVAPNGAGWETLGAGPHVAVSKHIAGKKHDDIVWTGLSKADWVDPDCYLVLLPKYEALTEALRKAHGDE